MNNFFSATLSQKQYQSYFNREGIDPAEAMVFNASDVAAAFNELLQHYPPKVEYTHARLTNLSTNSSQEIPIHASSVAIYSQQGRLFRTTASEQGMMGIERLLASIIGSGNSSFSQWDSVWIFTYAQWLELSTAQSVVDATRPDMEHELLELIIADKEPILRVGDLWSNTVTLTLPGCERTRLFDELLNGAMDQFIIMQYRYRHPTGRVRVDPKTIATELVRRLCEELTPAEKNDPPNYAINPHAPVWDNEREQRHRMTQGLVRQIVDFLHRLHDWAITNTHSTDVVFAFPMTGRLQALVHYPIDFRVVHYEYHLNNPDLEHDD